MNPEALNNYVYLGIGMLICIVPFIIMTFLTYCTLIMSARADRRKDKLLEKKYGKGHDNENHY